MRFAIFGAALNLSVGLLGASIASAAMPANGHAAVIKAGSASDVIQVGGGCGARRGKAGGDWRGQLQLILPFVLKLWRFCCLESGPTNGKLPIEKRGCRPSFSDPR